MVFEKLLGKKKNTEEEIIEEQPVNVNVNEPVQVSEPPKKQEREIKYGKLEDVLSEYKSSEIEEIIVQLANGGTSKSEIGLILRDQYGIPNVKQITGKTVTEILQARNIEEEIPEELMNLIRKTVTLLNHMTKNKKDYTAKRGYQLTVSKINKLAKYYRVKKLLPANWRYSDESAKLLVK